MDGFPNLRGDNFLRVVGINDRETRGFVFRELEETVAEAAVEGFTGGFDAVGGKAAGVDTGKTGFGGNVEEKGEVGDEVVGGEGVERAEGGEVETASVTLVREGGIGEAVANDPCSGVERGTDDALAELRAAGEKKHDLGAVNRGFARVVVLEQAADVFAKGRAAGFACQEDGLATGFEALFEEAGVGGFAGAFGSFEGDENASRRF